MKALLKDGKTWTEIDTGFLFNNQYNTTDGKRIYDNQIRAIRDDARKNMGRCRYCGAMVKRGEEEKHFTEREAGTCEKCFWHRQRREKISDETKTETTETGEEITVRTKREKVTYYCSYPETTGSRTGCTCSECRAYGIEWFTPENTFFLKYPDGFSSIPEVDKLEARGFILDPRSSVAHYQKKIGSYRLYADLEYTDGRPTGINYYRIYNARRDYNFRIENGTIYTDKYSFGFRQAKTLEGVRPAVMEAIMNICNHKTEEAKVN